MNTEDPPFVKKFDFRGIYNKVIFDQDAYYLGLALHNIMPLKKILLGWDTRESSRNLAYAFINALKDKNVEISYMDKCPIDYVTVGANAFDFDLSIMFTGSHHPWNWTGLLMHTKGGDSIQGELVEKIVEKYYEAAREPYVAHVVDLSPFQNFHETLEGIYAAQIKSLIPLSDIKQLKVLVDVGDGSGSRSLTLLEKLLPQVTFSRLNDRQLYDASSPHIADPSEVENMKEVLIDTKKGGYDAGFAFDSDADRVLAVDETGEYINGSLLGAAQAESFIARGLSDKLFGYAVDCGPAMHNALASFVSTKSNVDAVPVGRSILRKMIRDSKVDFAVENVGHFYAKDFFMTDSGTFSLAVILYWMSRNGALSTIKQKYPDGKRGQIFVPVPPSDKENAAFLYERINKRYEGKKEKKIEIDGTRYEFFDGDQVVAWYTMRKSGYEQVEKYYFGALNEDEFVFMKKTFEDLFEEKKRKV